MNTFQMSTALLAEKEERGKNQEERERGKRDVPSELLVR